MYIYIYIYTLYLFLQYYINIYSDINKLLYYNENLKMNHD